MKVRSCLNLLSVLCMGVLCGTAAAGELKQIPYNNPGLVVDLGVGLWAWPVPCDADGDGDFDLIVSCPDKPSNGIWFFENASGDTAEDPMPVFKAAKKLSSTRHYVMPSYVDGQLRVLTPGFEYPNFVRTGLEQKTAIPLAPEQYYQPQWNEPKGPKLRHNQWRYVDYDGDKVLDLIVGIEDWSEYGWDDAFNAEGKWTHGPLHGFVLLYRNTGTNEDPSYQPFVKIEAEGKPIDTFGCPSPNFGDFDGDGDLDLLCGEFLDGFTYFENVGSRTEPRYSAGQPLKQPGGELVKMDLEMIAPVALDWDKDGDLDLIVGDEDGRVAFVENVTESNPIASNSPQSAQHGAPVFAAPRYFQQQAGTLKCGALATPVAVDWDNDGDIDIVSGNTAGYFEFFENLSGPNVAEPRWAGPVRLQVVSRLSGLSEDQVPKAERVRVQQGKEPFRIMAGRNGSVQGPAEAKWGYTTFSVADWDGDGLNDIVFNSILGRVQWLKNIGRKGAPLLAPAQPVEVEWESENPKPAWTWWTPQGKELVTQWRTTPVVHDFTGDGIPDLAMLDTEGYLALFERKQDGKQRTTLPPRRVFVDANHQPLRLNSKTAGGSGRHKIAVADWDGDGIVDLLLNSSNADFYRGLGEKDGKWRFEKVGTLASQNIEGHDVSPTTADFDGNGVPDFIGGAEDGRFYALNNQRQPNASEKRVAAAEPGLVKSEWIYQQSLIPSCHASTIVETENKQIVAAWFGGTAEKNPDVGIWVARIQQDGSWTTPVEVANGLQDDGTRYPCWNPVLFQPKGGKLMLYYKVGPSPIEWWGVVRTSEDDGITWSEAKLLPKELLGPVKNKPVQLEDGTIISGSSLEGQTQGPVWHIHFERSTDNAQTWEFIKVPYEKGSPETIQPSILVLKNGDLMALGRSQQDRIFKTYSHDKGKTWEAPTLMSLPNPNSGTDAVTMKNGRHVLIYNHTEHGRFPLNIAVSEDGTDWNAALVLESEKGEFSYPAIIQTSDGMLHATYTWNRKRIRHVVIDPAKLKLQPIKEGAWPK